MKGSGTFDLDAVPGGYFSTNASRQVAYFNSYLVDQFGWQADETGCVDYEARMTRASHLFCDSYVYPQLTEKGYVEEAQLTFHGKDAERIPVVVNARQTADGGTIWNVSTAKNRDKLFDELVAARNLLEEQAKQLKMLSTTDELTGIMNRRALNNAAEKVFAQADRDGAPVSIALLDIDEFKKINDTYGHTVGDDVLREMGEGLSEVCRGNETVARFGGEEFIVVLGGANSSEALVLCDRLHARVADMMKEVCHVTVSIGVATRFGRHGPTFADLLTQTDDALYQAKAEGKNRTVVGGNSRPKQIVKPAETAALDDPPISNFG